MTARQYLRRHWLAVALLAAGAVILGAAVLLLRTMPPRTITMATGSEGGTYHEVGKFYRAILAQSGVELRLVATDGAVENLALLRDPHSNVHVGLVQGGNARESDANVVESLGTLFFEPLWLFYRRELGPLDIDSLHGRKVSIGPKGSGTQALALDLLQRSGADQDAAELLMLGTQATEEKLLNGEIDAAMMMLSWDSPVVKRLLADERIELASFRHADAYVALFPVSQQGDPAGRCRRPRQEAAARRRRAGGAEGQPDRQEGLLHLDPVPAAQHRGADSFGARHLPARRAVSGRRGHRHPAQRRGAAVLQIGPAVPQQSAAVLDGGADRPPAVSAHSGGRRAVPAAAVHAGGVRLGHAPQDRAHLRRTAVSGSRDGNARPAIRSRRGRRTVGRARTAGQSTESADRVRQHALSAAPPHRAGARPPQGIAADATAAADAGAPPRLPA